MKLGLWMLPHITQPGSGLGRAAAMPRRHQELPVVCPGWGLRLSSFNHQVLELALLLLVHAAHPSCLPLPKSHAVPVAPSGIFLGLVPHTEVS